MEIKGISSLRNNASILTRRLRCTSLWKAPRKNHFDALKWVGPVGIWIGGRRHSLSKEFFEENQGYLANNGSFENDEKYRPNQVRIWCDMIPILERYDRLIWYHSELKKRLSAPKAAVWNVGNWLKNNKYAIHDPKKQFNNREGDLIAVVH